MRCIFAESGRERVRSGRNGKESHAAHRRQNSIMTKCKHGVDTRFCALCNRAARPVTQTTIAARRRSTARRPDHQFGIRAREVLTPGETAVALFTRGDHFALKADGTAVTGNWKLNPKRRFDKVVIYKQDSRGNLHQIFIGVPVEIADSREEGRREIRLANVRLVGTTGCNWNEFTDTNSGSINPVIYVR
ncbi:MAG TPA: hypothetical protein VFA27_07145 [Vicinamibacterales bacterium]|nr:hypothetical protein [Vicinamibacterales bacterium]